MYDQTGSTEENPFAGNEAGFNQQDIFNAFRSGFGRGNHRQGESMGFESMFQDLFGGMGRKQRGQQQSADEMSEDILIRYDIDFNESVNGATKVQVY